MLLLDRPSVELTPSYLDFLDEMRVNGDKVWDGIAPKAGESNSAFASRILNNETHPPAGLVADSTYWPTLDGIVVGRIALRHELNDNLKVFGGHIGYEVRPSSRRKGFAKEMLSLILQTPKARAIGRLLLTCDPANTASNRTILANGGVLEKTEFIESWQRLTNYYWIDLSKISHSSKA